MSLSRVARRAMNLAAVSGPELRTAVEKRRPVRADTSRTGAPSDPRASSAEACECAHAANSSDLQISASPRPNPATIAPRTVVLSGVARQTVAAEPGVYVRPPRTMNDTDRNVAKPHGSLLVDRVSAVRAEASQPAPLVPRAGTNPGFKELEVSCTALPGGPVTQTTCGDGRGPNVAQIVVSGGGGEVLSMRSDFAGQTVDDLSQAGKALGTINCLIGPFDAFAFLTDNAVVRLPLQSAHVTALSSSSQERYRILRLVLANRMRCALPNDPGPFKDGVDLNFGALKSPIPASRALVFNHSGDGGKTWRANSRVQVDDLVDPSTGRKLGAFADRPTMYVDEGHHQVYVAMRVSESLYPSEGYGAQYTVILGADTDPYVLHWRVVAAIPHPIFGPNKTAIVADPDPREDRLFLFQCPNFYVGNAGKGHNAAIPQLLTVEGPSGAAATVRSVPLGGVLPLGGFYDESNPQPQCPFQNRFAEPQIVSLGLRKDGTRQLRVAYLGLTSNPNANIVEVLTGRALFQMLHVADIDVAPHYSTTTPSPYVFGTSPSYFRVTLRSRRDVDAADRNTVVMWPDLQDSGAGNGHQQMLQWTEVDASGVLTVKADTWRAGGWRGERVLDRFSVDLDMICRRSAQEKADALAARGDARYAYSGCFFGDYRHGTFVDSQYGFARFFAYWVSTSPAGKRSNWALVPV